MGVETKTPAMAATIGRGSKSVMLGKDHRNNKQHNARLMTSRTLIPEFSDDGALTGWSLFPCRADARAFLRAGGAR
ncbi:hypothetical protein C4E04_19090 [Microvirga sp. 17 mud 1-3]|nr:hypothetical protein C4E04_19090 [Microvirga sp. 17 mud 1-3]